MLGLLMVALLFIGCGQPQQQSGGPKVNKNTIKLLFTYGSEKKAWIKEVTQEFNGMDHKTAGGKKIHVEAEPMGSGEAVNKILDGESKPHICSPASDAFIKLGNAWSQDRGAQELFGESKQLVLSPVVIAMWKPMAEALGWPEKQLGWSDILSMAKNEKGWEAYGHPEWGKFKFGHTHPDFSNSGLISLLAEAYAAAGTTGRLTMDMIEKPETAEYIKGIESAIVHYGRSTGFFGKKMMKNGPSYLSAAVLYESIVVESYDPKHNLAQPLIAIYPKEGTFWSDHPVAVVERDWVTPEQREAADIYIKYLLEDRQQEKAMKHGFRPANLNIKLGSPIDEAHGVDPDEPKTLLQAPKVKIIEAIRKLWKANKKHAHVVLVLDVSGSMNQNNIIAKAREGALQLIDLLGEKDIYSLLKFNDRTEWLDEGLVVGANRQRLKNTVSSLQAGGGTALYDAISEAHKHMSNNSKEDMISAIIVLSDGEDRNSTQVTLNRLIEQIKFNSEQKTIRVFSIGYGEEAPGTELEKISDTSQGTFNKGKPENIIKVFKRDISSFF